VGVADFGGLPLACDAGACHTEGRIGFSRGCGVEAGARRRYGVALVTLSAVMWSTAGLFVRWAGLDTWTMVGWRSLFTALVLGTLAVVQARRRGERLITRFGRPEAVTVAVSCVSAMTYVLSLRLTTVANVMIVYATVPFIATAIAYVWVGERITRRFMVAGVVVLAAIGAMAGGAASARDAWGLLAALVMTCGFGAQLVNARAHPGLDMSLLTAIAALVCVPLAMPFMAPGIPAPHQLCAAALYGGVTTGLAYVLAMAGGRLIGSGEAGLISMLDVVLGPVWVWLIFDERPVTAAMISGAVVLGTVLWYLMGDQDKARERRVA